MVLATTNRKGLEPYYENHKNMDKKLTSLYEKFVPSGTHVRSSDPTQSMGSRTQPQKRNKSSVTKPHAQIPLKYPVAQAPKVPRNSGKKTNKKRTQKGVPKNKIVFLADFLIRFSKTPVEISGRI